MDLGLQGKIALVTGGSRGIGKAIARTLASEGASVAICARDLSAVTSTAYQLAQETSGVVFAFEADTSSSDSIERLVQSVVRQFGGLDILVNNAARTGGTGGPDTLQALNEPMLEEDFQVKVMGYLRCAKFAAPHMVGRGWGRIVNIDGMAARQAAGVSGGLRNAAVMNFTKVLSEELGESGVTVNAVHPAVTRTESLIERARAAGRDLSDLESGIAKNNAIGRIVDAQEIGPIVAFLCSDQAACITGEAIGASGGSSRAVFY